MGTFTENPEVIQSLPTATMASLIARNIAKIARNNSFIASARCYSDVPYVEPHKGKVPSDKIDMPDELGHAVGPHRWEILAKLAGNDDPYDFKHHKMGSCGTKENPNLVPSSAEKRLVGCVCEEDSVSFKWMELYKGEQRRCGCGYWFKLVDLQHEDYGQ